MRIIKKIFSIKSGKKFFIKLHEESLLCFLAGMYESLFSDKFQYKIYWFFNKPRFLTLHKQKRTHFEYNPLFSVVVPLYNTPTIYLKKLIKSIISQSYGNGELCLVDCSDNHEETRNVIEKFKKKDPRIKVRYEQNNKGISNNTNLALAMARGDYIVFSDHDDEVAPNAFFEIVKILNFNKELDLIYTDEDKIFGNTKKHFFPHFKSDFNLYMLRSSNYFCHLVCVSRKLYNKVGNLRPEYDGAQDYDFVLRCIENTDQIYHIPKILYHGRHYEGSTAGNEESKLYAYESGKKAIKSHYERCGICDIEVDFTYVNENILYGIYRTRFNNIKKPLISIIIPNKDHIDDLDKCIKSLYLNNNYKNIEVIIVENNSKNEETFKYYEKVKVLYKNLKVVKGTGKGFNYSSLNNYGASLSAGDYFLFLNNDTEILNPDSIYEMVAYCQLNNVGAVGAKLYFEDGSIQHTGVIVGLKGVAGHIFSGFEHYHYGYFAHNFMVHNLSAVTAACMLVKKNVFNKIQGFNEDFAVAFNDIDFCLRIRAACHDVLFTPFSEWYHYESKTRGKEDTCEKKRRFKEEVVLFQNAGGQFLQNRDPYFNENFTRLSLNYVIKP